MLTTGFSFAVETNRLVNAFAQMLGDYVLGLR
jgi:hypothetical protein